MMEEEDAGDVEHADEEQQPNEEAEGEGDGAE